MASRFLAVALNRPPRLKGPRHATDEHAGKGCAIMGSQETVRIPDGVARSGGSIQDCESVYNESAYILNTDVSRVLNSLEHGDPSAASELLPLVYEELRRLAVSRMRRESGDHTLQATALVHEAYIKLTGTEGISWQGRVHFFAAAAEAMRRILIDSARRRKSTKQGGDLVRYQIHDFDAVIQTHDADELLDLDEALTKLSTSEPELAKLVELRYFAGLSVEESARMLGISPRSVKRNWAYARAWLGRALDGGS